MKQLDSRAVLKVELRGLAEEGEKPGKTSRLGLERGKREMGFRVGRTNSALWTC